MKNNNYCLCSKLKAYIHSLKKNLACVSQKHCNEFEWVKRSFGDKQPGFCSAWASVHQMFTSYSWKRRLLNSKPLCVCLWTRRHVPCCWRRVCTTFRPNSSATLQSTQPSPTTAASHPSTRTPPRLRPPPPPPGSPPPSRCIGSAWLSMDALWPTPLIKVWRISSWLLPGAVVRCSAAAPRRCRRAWWSNWCGTSSRSWLWP